MYAISHVFSFGNFEFTPEKCIIFVTGVFFLKSDQVSLMLGTMQTRDEKRN